MHMLPALLIVASFAPAAEPDPVIESRILDITADSLLEHVEALMALGTRRWDQPGGQAAQAYIEELFGGLNLDDVYLQDFDGGSDNVVGVLHGSRDPEAIHVLGAHYDSAGDAGPTGPAPGADDNASGMAALMETARILGDGQHRPAETVLLVAFSGEEVGRKGSQAFVEHLAAENADVRDMICLDVIGYVEPGTEPDLSVSSIEFPPSILSLIDGVGEVAATYLPEWRFEGGPGCG